MAKRRCLSIEIIEHDNFIELSKGAQSLYLHFNMNADDDGFVGSPKRVMRSIEATQDEFEELVNNNFIIPFETGVIVVTHWNLHNTIAKDRYTKTLYQKEYDKLYFDENKVYTVDETYTKCSQHVDTTSELNKSNKNKNKSIKEFDPKPQIEMLNTLAQNKYINEIVLKDISEWVKYMCANGKPFTEIGLNALLNRIASAISEYGETKVVNLIQECISGGYTCIYFERLEKQKTKNPIKNDIMDALKNA